GRRRVPGARVRGRERALGRSRVRLRGVARAGAARDPRAHRRARDARDRRDFEEPAPPPQALLGRGRRGALPVFPVALLGAPLRADLPGAAGGSTVSATGDPRDSERRIGYAARPDRAEIVPWLLALAAPAAFLVALAVRYLFSPAAC